MKRYLQTVNAISAQVGKRIMRACVALLALTLLFCLPCGAESLAEAEPADAQKDIPLTAFVPDHLREELVRVETTIPEDSPAAILEELIRLEAVPDIDFGRNPYLEVGDGYVKVKGGDKKDSYVVRLDISGRLLFALDEASRTSEALFLQAMANTFLTYYGGEVFLLTTEGDKLETSRRDYERGFRMDQYARTES